MAGKVVTRKVLRIPIDDLRPHPLFHKILVRDPRYEQDRLVDLAESIRKVGQVLPIVVTEKDGKYYVVDGHRRLSALHILCHKDKRFCEAECIVVRNLSDLALFVNELAAHYKPSTLALLAAELRGKGYKIKDIAAAMGKSQSYISLLLKMAGDEQLLKFLDEGLDARIVYELSRIESRKIRARLAKEVMGMTRNRAIKHIREYRNIHSPKDEEKSLTVKVPVNDIKVQVENVPKVRTCFICGKTYRVGDVQRIDICARDMYMLSTLMSEMAKKGLTWDDLLKYVRSRKPKRV